LESKVIELENKSKDLEVRAKELEDKSKEVEKWNKTIFENSQDMIVIHDLNGNILDINEITYKKLGFDSKEQFFNKIKNVLDAIAAEEREKAIKNMSQVILKGFIGGNEYQIYNRYGEKLFFEEYTSLIYDLNNKPYAFLSVIRDITDKKKIEQELINQKKQLFDIIEYTPDPTLVIDANGVVIAFNRAMERLSGVKAKDIIGKGNYEYSIPFFGERRPILIDLALKYSTESIPKEYTYIKKEGDTLIAESTINNFKGKRAYLWGKAAPLYDKDGKVIGAIETIRDITDQKSSELALKELSDRLNTIIEAANVATWEWNVQTGETVFNEKWANILGYTLDELKPISLKTWESLTHPDDLEKVYIALEEHFKGKSSQYECEFRMKHKNGKWIWILSKGMVVKWADDGKPLLMYGTHTDITRLKEVEKALIESRQFINNVLDTIPVRVFWKDKSLRYLGCNKPFAMDAGFNSPEELIGKNDYEMGWKEQAELYRSDDKNIIETGISKIGYEEPQTTPEGKIIWLRTSKFPLKDNEGNIIGVLGTYEDITEKKMAEELLKESEEKFRILANMSPTSILLYQDDKWIYANPASQKLSEYDEKEILNMNFWDFVHPLDKDLVIERGKRRQRGEKVPDDYEFRIISKSGKIKWVHIYGSSIIYNGKPAAIISVLDITERKNAEEALLEEKEKLNITLQSIGDGVIATDKDGKIILINKAAQNLTGYEAFEALDRNFSEISKLFDENEEEILTNPVEIVLKTGDVYELPRYSTLISKDGTKRIINDSAAPIKDSSGNIFGVVLVFRDVTEKMKLMEQIQNAQKLESIGLLAAGIAHDFNNILVGIYGNINLAMECSFDENVKELLKNSVESIERAKALTNQLLTFSKGGEPAKKLQSIVPLLKNVTQFVISGSKVKDEFDIAENLYNAEFDYNQISQVIENIIINAIQAMPDGGLVKISAKNFSFKDKFNDKNVSFNDNNVSSDIKSISIDADNFQNDEKIKYKLKDQNITLENNQNLLSGDYIKISISDTGHGISKEILPKIFDPFFTTKEKGNGLGLSICHSIITKHQGFIDVESEEEKGTTFHIYLPAKKEKIIKETKKEEKKVLKSGRALILDDEEVIQKVLAKILNHIGFESIAVSDGEEAVEIFKKEKDKGNNFDLLIFDMTIKGGMGGDKAIEQIRKIDSNVISFVMSGYTDGPIFSDPNKFGFNEVIYKPFTIDDIKQLLVKYF
jgi:PAS domain S-box-containing protein